MSDTLLNFVHISDTHITPDLEYNTHYGDYTPLIGAKALVDHLNALPFVPDFVLHTGDVIYDPVPEAYETARAILGQIRCPIYYVAGNHDHAGALQSSLMGRADTISAPLDYDFEFNGVQMVCLDSNGPAVPPAGLLREETLRWLAEICAAPDDRPLVVAVHHNILPMGAPWWDDYMRIANGEELHQILLSVRHRLRGVFFGHVHQNTSTVHDGILYSSTKGSWLQLHVYPGQIETIPDRGAEPGFSLVTIARQQTFVRRYRFPLRSQ